LARLPIAFLFSLALLTPQRIADCTLAPVPPRVDRFLETWTMEASMYDAFLVGFSSSANPSHLIHAVFLKKFTNSHGRNICFAI
jgi:hypothetical protein